MAARVTLFFQALFTEVGGRDRGTLMRSTFVVPAGLLVHAAAMWGVSDPSQYSPLATRRRSKAVLIAMDNLLRYGHEWKRG